MDYATDASHGKVNFGKCWNKTIGDKLLGPMSDLGQSDLQERMLLRQKLPEGSKGALENATETGYREVGNKSKINCTC